MTERRNLAARVREVLRELELGHQGAEMMMGWRQHSELAACSCTDARMHRVIVDLLEVARELGQHALEAQRPTLPSVPLGRYDRSYASPEDKARREVLEVLLPLGADEDGD